MDKATNDQAFLLLLLFKVEEWGAHLRLSNCEFLQDEKPDLERKLAIIVD
jgi:hypothetical protein